MLRTSSRVAARRAHSVAAHYYPHEPVAPELVTAKVPGPKLEAARAALAQVYDVNTANFVVDYKNLVGNYVSDVDGNRMLDVFQQIALIALGYNNPALIKAARLDEQVCALVNRPALAVFPSLDYHEILETGLLKAAPPGMTRVWTSSHGLDANEMAFKAAFMLQHARERGQREFTAEEIESSMHNQAPGALDKVIMSFRGAFHGRLFGLLSATRSKPIHKLDIPAFDWPMAPFPKLQYPLEAHEAANRAEETQCLEEIDRLIRENGKVAAIIVEPVQAEGGDNHATPFFFQGLRKLTEDHGVFLIVDEVQTGGGGTGKMWAHEHWGLALPPDMVTFSKKMQAAGFYFYEKELQPKLAYRQFHTWCGDPLKALIARAIIDEIAKHDLLARTAAVGDYVYGELAQLEQRGAIANLRGKGMGTFQAFDLPLPDARNQLIANLKAMGVVAGGCGEQLVRLRPSLTFEKKHADVFLERLALAL